MLSPLIGLSLSSVANLPSISTTASVVVKHLQEKVNCSVQCPTLMEFPNEWPLYILVFMYLGLLGAAIAVIRATPWKSSRVAVLLIRSFCYIVQLPWVEMALLTIMYTVPILLQFITFILVTGYIVRMFIAIYTRYERRQFWFKALNFATIGVILLIIILDSALFAHCYLNNCGSAEDGFDHNLALFSAITFMIVTLLLGLSGSIARRIIRKCKNDREDAKQIYITHMLYQLRIIFQLLVLYTMVFAARSLWSLTYAAHSNKAQDYIAHLSRTNLRGLYISSICFYGIFEGFPMGFLIFSMYQICKVESQSYQLKVTEDGDNDSLDEDSYLIQHPSSKKNFSW